MAVKLEGKGKNRYWHIPRGLEVLQGALSSAMLLLEELDKHIELRDTKSEPHPDMLGNGAVATFVVAYLTEIAIKTLFAQINPLDKPPQGHDLLDVFNFLSQETQREVQDMFENMEPLGGDLNWLGENESVKEILKIGRFNFNNWRYLMEKEEVTDGIPKGLINVAQAIMIVCQKKVFQDSDITLT